jgi:transposase InsO family protein
VEATGKPVGIYAFVMVLGYSRMRYVEFTTSMRIEYLLSCQMNAFSFFEGIPHRLLFDNMKQVKLDAQTWNPLFLDFVRHYGIAAHTHAPYRPRSKGKAERLVRFVKDNFLNGRSFADLEDLNAQGRAWLDKANGQTHGTTGQIPCERWQQHERSELRPLSTVAPYQLCRQVSRIVDWGGMVRFERSRYSVPPRYAGHKVVVELRGQKITVRCDEIIIASHQAALRPDSYVVQQEHLEALWRQTLKRTTQHPVPLPRWQMRFAHEVERADLDRYQRLAENGLAKERP